MGEQRYVRHAGGSVDSSPSAHATEGLAPTADQSGPRSRLGGESASVPPVLVEGDLEELADAVAASRTTLPRFGSPRASAPATGPVDPVVARPAPAGTGGEAPPRAAVLPAVVPLLRPSLTFTTHDPTFGAPPDGPTLVGWKPRDQVSRRRRTLVAAIAALTLAAAAALAVLALVPPGPNDAPAAVVRVVAGAFAGTGFLVEGPDDHAHVATAYHVVEGGEPIVIERNVEVSPTERYVEAYPEVQIVAFDADADLAILRIEGVRGAALPRLALAAAPASGQTVVSYGFPARDGATRTGLVSRGGRVLSGVRFPAYDRRYGRVVRAAATEGFLVSTDLEAGLGGGPMCDEAGAVVGVNVARDPTHGGQSGAVAIAALRSLLAGASADAATSEPTPGEVAELLRRLQATYLSLPVSERTQVRESEIMSPGDVRRLRRLVDEVRRFERDTSPATFPELQLSGRAAMGLYFVPLPGKLLETYMAPATQSALFACDRAGSRFGEVVARGEARTARGEPGGAACHELAMRPLAWDLVAGTLGWEGRERELAVTKVERTADDASTYRASVRAAGSPAGFDVRVTLERGALRLSVFDETGAVYARATPRTIDGGALRGAWTASAPRTAIDRDSLIEVSEQLFVTVADDGGVSLKHVVHHHAFAAEGRALPFPCNWRREIDVGLVQSFSGTLQNGIVVARRTNVAETIGSDAARCPMTYTPDAMVALELQGGRLLMARTDGARFPDVQELTRR